MFSAVFVTGTDTDVGKSVACAWLLNQLQGEYWKPVQSGLEEKDVDAVCSYAGLSADRVHPSLYELTQPLSPHEAAKRDGLHIDLSRFSVPEHKAPLIVEGAGGLMVPLNEEALIIDLIEQLQLPVILVSRSSLGTINHTLLSLEALRARSIPVLGIIMNGEPSPHNHEALSEYGQVPILAQIPLLEQVTPEALAAVSPDLPLEVWA